MRTPPPRRIEPPLRVAGLVVAREKIEPARIAIKVYDALRELAGDGDELRISEAVLVKKSGLPRRAVVNGLRDLERVGLKTEGLD